MEAMSKKEKLARGSAVIKVMRVIPRSGHYLSSYVDVYKMPRSVKPPLPKGMPEAVLEMPHLDMRYANFDLLTKSAKIAIPYNFATGGPKISKSGDPCDDDEGPDLDDLLKEETELGLPDGHKFMKWFGYREWAKNVFPPYDPNIAEHFNILLGLLMTMCKDPENENFPDIEAFPCVQFLRTIKTPDGSTPTNVGSLIEYLGYLCMKILEDA